LVGRSADRAGGCVLRHVPTGKERLTGLLAKAFYDLVEFG
jgi:hypothetical protein